MDKLPIGTRIKFKREITEDATGDHPKFLLAERYELGTIARVHDSGDFAYSVIADHWPGATFLANREDFEPEPMDRPSYSSAKADAAQFRHDVTEGGRFPAGDHQV